MFTVMEILPVHAVDDCVLSMYMQVLGRVSTSTIAGGIADINAFTREPQVWFDMYILLPLQCPAAWL
jgi:hypothetical protein